jgi:hypothetical protein
MFANELRRAVEAASRKDLPELAALMWRAFAADQITEAEAEELSNRIELRKIDHPIPQALRKPVGSRPRTGESLQRRRRWAAAGRLPPALAAHFTQAEVAVLAVLADTVVRMGDCRRCIEQIAALAGVCRSTVKNAVRQAEVLGLVTVERRARTAWRNLPNIVRIISLEWQAWNRLARRSLPTRGGVKFLTCTNTKFTEQQKNRESRTLKSMPRRQRKIQESSSDANPASQYKNSDNTGTN